MSFKLGLFNFLDVKRLSSSLNLMELMGCIPAVLEEMVATISVIFQQSAFIAEFHFMGFY